MRARGNRGPHGCRGYREQFTLLLELGDLPLELAIEIVEELRGFGTQLFALRALRIEVVEHGADLVEGKTE